MLVYHVAQKWPENLQPIPYIRFKHVITKVNTWNSSLQCGFIWRYFSKDKMDPSYDLYNTWSLHSMTQRTRGNWKLCTFEHWLEHNTTLLIGWLLDQALCANMCAFDTKLYVMFQHCDKVYIYIYPTSSTSFDALGKVRRGTALGTWTLVLYNGDIGGLLGISIKDNHKVKGK